MEEQNVLDLLVEIQQIAAASEVDAEKVIKGNSTAGIRLRKTMQQIKSLAQEVRDGVQNRKKES
jgi:hypothetical protein